MKANLDDAPLARIGATTICFQNKKGSVGSETREKQNRLNRWKNKQIKNSEKVKNDFVQEMAVAVAQR